VLNNIKNAIPGRAAQPLPTRQALVAIHKSLDLKNVAYYDWADTDSNPLDETVVGRMDDLIDRQLERAWTTSDYASIKRRGEALRRRLHEVGSTREPVLLIVGEKR
jgi:hypothetical protein